MVFGTMEVTLVGARGLRDTELFGKIDPYVVLQYRSQEHKSHTHPTSTKPSSSSSRPRIRCCLCLRGQGRNPEWNQTFKFRVEYPGSVKLGEQHQLVLKVMDHDTFTQDDYLGQTIIYLKDLFEQGIDDGKAELRPQKYRVVSSNKSYRGEIQVGITFTAKKESDEREFGGWKESEGIISQTPPKDAVK